VYNPNSLNPKENFVVISTEKKRRHLTIITTCSSITYCYNFFSFWLRLPRHI